MLSVVLCTRCVHSVVVCSVCCIRWLLLFTPHTKTHKKQSGKVYNVTDFLKDHPGGKKVIMNLGLCRLFIVFCFLLLYFAFRFVCVVLVHTQQQTTAGKDATQQFNLFHKAEQVLAKHGPKLYIGNVGGLLF